MKGTPRYNVGFQTGKQVGKYNRVGHRFVGSLKEMDEGATDSNLPTL